MSETIAIASDHGGVELKSLLKKELSGKGLTVLDLGTEGAESVDYPDFADKLAAAIRAGQAKRGVLICGSGIGISIAANRHPEIRALGAEVKDGQALPAQLLLEQRLELDAAVVAGNGDGFGHERSNLTESSGSPPSSGPD